MSILKEYKKLEKKANLHHSKHDSECIKILELITPLLSPSMTSQEQYVFRQPSDVYVLVTEEGFSFPKNTPVSSIINWFEKTGELIDKDILHTLSI